jgi:hypothetical protein
MAGRQWRHIGALFILSIFGNVAFWATFEQAGTSLTLFAEQSVDLWIGSTGVTMPSSWFQMANPLFIMVLAPAFSALWLKLNARGQEPSTPMKFVLGLALVGGGFAVMAHAGALADGGHRIGPGWLILTYFLNSGGHPVGAQSVGVAADGHVAGLPGAGQPLGWRFGRRIRAHAPRRLLHGAHGFGGRLGPDAARAGAAAAQDDARGGLKSTPTQAYTGAHVAGPKDVFLTGRAIFGE